MCTCRDRGTVDVKVDAQCSGLGEDAVNLRLELGVKDSAAEEELVLVVFDYGYCCFAAALLLLDNPRLEELQRAEHRFLLLHPEAYSSGSEA